MNFFKNYLIVTISIGLLFTSCKDDDGDDTKTEAVSVSEDRIVGKWNMTAFTSETKTVTEAFGETSTVTSSQVGSDFDYTITFSSNPNIFEIEGSFVNTVKTNFNGVEDERKINFDTDNLSALGDMDNVIVASTATTGTWELEGNKLISTSDNIKTIGEITEISDGVLEVVIDLSQTDVNIDKPAVEGLEGIEIGSEVIDSFEGLEGAEGLGNLLGGSSVEITGSSTVKYTR